MDEIKRLVQEKNRDGVLSAYQELYRKLFQNATGRASQDRSTSQQTQEDTIDLEKGSVIRKFAKVCILLELH